LRERRGSVRANDRSCVFCLSLVLFPGHDGAGVPEVVGTVLVADEYEGDL